MKFIYFFIVIVLFIVGVAMAISLNGTQCQVLADAGAMGSVMKHFCDGPLAAPGK